MSTTEENVQDDIECAQEFLRNAQAATTKKDVHYWLWQAEQTISSAIETNNNR